MKKLMWIIVMASSVLFNIGCGQAKGSKYSETYELLKVGEVKADGWMLEQMKQDLNTSYLGKFDKICPYIDQDVYNAKRVTSTERFKDYPDLSCWWGAEEEGYWKEGVLRMAVQSDNKKFLTLVKEWMERLLEYQDTDGYIGMYKGGDKPNTRFKHESENAELWCQKTIMLPMLAWYEYTGDKRFLDGVIKAVDFTMRHYKDRNIFKYKGPKRGGVSHAVGFVDAMEWLYRLTGDQKYLDFVVKMYRDYNECPPRDDDLTLAHLLDTERKLHKHTPHIAEGMYIPLMVAKITGKADVRKAADILQEKLDYHFTPGGGIVGDEDCGGQQGTADMYREYCGVVETVFSYNRVVMIDGDENLSDKVETMTFNALQGARLPDLRALEYLSSDNRLEINGCGHAGRLAYDANRFFVPRGTKFDPAKFRQDAVCCVTNAGRVLPFYIEGMWMKGKDRPSLYAMCYGPSVLNTTLAGRQVQIKQKTHYPFSDNVSFELSADRPIKYDLILRVPEGAEDIVVKNGSGAKVSRKGRFVILSKKWKSGDEVEISFPFTTQRVSQPISSTVPRPGFYLKRGALVYALAFPYELEESFEYNNTGYYRYEVKTLGRKGWDYSIDPQEEFTLHTRSGADCLRPWFKSPVVLKGKMVNSIGKKVDVELVPLGTTVLRRAVFPGVK